MITFRRFLMQFAAAAVLLAVLAGCGGDDDGDASPDTTEATPDDATDETRPPDDTEPPADDDDDAGENDTGTGGGAGTISSFTVEVVSPGAGIDLAGAVTAAEVEEDNDPLSTWIVCSAVEAPDPSSYAGMYFITVLMRNSDSGITSFGVQTFDDVDGPGTYPGSFRVGIAGQSLLETEGELTLDADMGGGTITGSTPDGDDITATYRCEV